MADTPAFFVPSPFATPENQEKVYADFTEWAHKNYAPAMRWNRDSLPPPGQRIYSITFTSHGEQWTATVGEQLRGEKVKKPRRRGDFPRVERLMDPATVLAIFPGDPCIVVTNANISGARSHFANPFMAGGAYGAVLFAAG